MSLIIIFVIKETKLPLNSILRDLNFTNFNHQYRSRLTFTSYPPQAYESPWLQVRCTSLDPRVWHVQFGSSHSASNSKNRLHFPTRSGSERHAFLPSFSSHPPWLRLLRRVIGRSTAIRTNPGSFSISPARFLNRVSISSSNPGATFKRLVTRITR